jgi:hypothetical protein
LAHKENACSHVEEHLKTLIDVGFGRREKKEKKI